MATLDERVLALEKRIAELEERVGPKWDNEHLQTITMSEVSRRYGIARDTVRDAMKAGKLPWVPRGRALVVSAKRAHEIWGVR